MMFLVLAFSVFSALAEVPPLSEAPHPYLINSILNTSHNCVNLVKSYLSSSEFNSDESNDQINKACVNADTVCVREVGESLRSGERSEAAKFFPLVRACQGTGKGACYRGVLE